MSIIQGGRIRVLFMIRGMQGMVVLRTRRLGGRFIQGKKKSKVKELVTGAGEPGLFESHLHDTWKEIEEQGMDTCQSSYLSSSENSDSDKDIF